MKNWNATEARAHFSELLDEAQDEPQIILAHGKPYAMVRKVSESELSNANLKKGKMHSLVYKLDSMKGEGDTLPLPDKKFQKPRKIKV